MNEPENTGFNRRQFLGASLAVGATTAAGGLGVGLYSQVVQADKKRSSNSTCASW